jgi:hypothetical protein
MLIILDKKSRDEQEQIERGEVPVVL